MVPLRYSGSESDIISWWDWYYLLVSSVFQPSEFKNFFWWVRGSLLVSPMVFFWWVQWSPLVSPMILPGEYVSPSWWVQISLLVSQVIPLGESGGLSLWVRCSLLVCHVVPNRSQWSLLGGQLVPLDESSGPFHRVLLVSPVVSLSVT